MINQEIIKIANERIQIEIVEQNNNLIKEIERIKSKMAAQGTLMSSVTINCVSNLCIEAVKNRTQLIWQILFRFITTTGISYYEELSKELKSIVASNLPKELADLRGYINDTANIARAPIDVKGIFEAELDVARNQALKKVGTEIDLFVHSLKAKTTAQKNESLSPIFNIYSPVGSIQTGEGSIANIIQNIDTEVREQIRKALEEISITLNEPGLEITFPKEELIEVVKETHDELQKDKPNITRLKSLLTTIGTSIQVVSSLKPAYETLKQALTYLGISLP
jgi:hypothetical protein